MTNRERKSATLATERRRAVAQRREIDRALGRPSAEAVRALIEAAALTVKLRPVKSAGGEWRQPGQKILARALARIEEETK